MLGLEGLAKPLADLGVCRLSDIDFIYDGELEAIGVRLVQRRKMRMARHAQMDSAGVADSVFHGGSGESGTGGTAEHSREPAGQALGPRGPADHALISLPTETVQLDVLTDDEVWLPHWDGVCDRGISAATPAVEDFLGTGEADEGQDGPDGSYVSSVEVPTAGDCTAPSIPWEIGAEAWGECQS